MHVVKGDWNWAVSWNNRKKVCPYRCFDGQVKEPYEISMALRARPLAQLLLQSACISMCIHMYNWNIVVCYVKAILQLLIYKALYDKSYLGSKTSMTSGEWTCLILFATAPLTCSERGGSEKFKMKIYVSSGIRTHTPPVHDRKVAAP